MINTQNFQRFAIAGALAAALASVGVAASAQTTATPVATTVNATTVSMSTVSTQTSRRVELEQANADARRVAFRHLGFNF